MKYIICSNRTGKSHQRIFILWQIHIIRREFILNLFHIELGFLTIPRPNKIFIDEWL